MTLPSSRPTEGNSYTRLYDTYTNPSGHDELTGPIYNTLALIGKDNVGNAALVLEKMHHS